MKNILFILISFSAFLSCFNARTDENINDDFGVGEMVLEDTLRLTEGKVPNEWVKISLIDGYYIGFPKEPKKKEKNDSQQIEFKLKRSNYKLQCTLTDLATEPSFEKNKKYRAAYYQAIIEDLLKDKGIELESQKAFYSQAIYEGIRATFVGENIRMYMQCVIIENILYTASFILLTEESPVFLQLKDKFFYSFGNDFYRNQYEPIDTNQTL